MSMYPLLPVGTKGEACTCTNYRMEHPHRLFRDDVGALVRHLHLFLVVIECVDVNGCARRRCIKIFENSLF